MSQGRSSQLFKLGRKLASIRLSNRSNKEYEYRRMIFDELKGMGGVYFKCLQVLAVTHKFLEGWAGPKEMSVFNKIPTEAINIDAYIKDPDMFESYEREPFAAGSFAQVYRGRLKTGQDVAIKVLRPSIANHLVQDLRYIKRLAGIFSKFLPNVILDYNKVFNEFCNNCILETDYRREVENMKYFSKFYHDHPYVVIPSVYDELCGDDVIVQDYIDGPTFADVLMQHTPADPSTAIAKRLSGSDLWCQLIVAGGEALRMAMVADYVYGDPHPGNIKLLPGNKIAFIDFGIIANKPTSQMAFYEWTLAYHNVLDQSGKLEALVETTLQCFCPDIAISLRTCRTDEGLPVLETLSEAVSSKFDSMNGNDKAATDLAANGHFFRLFTDVLDSGNALNVKLDTSNFQLLKAMQAYLGSMTVLDDSETGDRFSWAMLSAMKYALSYADHSGVKNDMPLRSRFSQGESYELLLDTFSSLAEGDQFLFQYLCGKVSL